MAVCALQLCVCPIQRKVRRACVIEFPDVPTIRRMAVVAFLAQAALVFVRGLMAVETSAGRVLVRRCQMALLARHDYVLPDQREVGEVMIEPDIGAPAFHAMTVLALTSQPAGVNVTCLVTAVAIRRQLLGSGVRGMA